MESPILILYVSTMPYLSIARHYGGIKCFNKEYAYIPERDVLIEKKYMKNYNKIMKESNDAETNWNNFMDFVKKINN